MFSVRKYSFAVSKSTQLEVRWIWACYSKMSLIPLRELEKKCGDSEGDKMGKTQLCYDVRHKAMKVASNGFRYFLLF